jgi:hypothetical protein
MGMDVLILHTLGRRSGQPRETPVAWFADGQDGRFPMTPHPRDGADREQAGQRIAAAQPASSNTVRSPASVGA